MKYFFISSAKVFFWEFVQNFPLLLGFIFTLENLKHKEWLLMLFSSILGSVTGAVMIRYTEPNIIPGSREPVKVTLINMLNFLIIMCVVAFYFAQRWGSWQTDVLLGILIGFGVGYSQDLAAGTKKPGVRHILALTCAFIPAMLAIRHLIVYFSPFLTILILNTAITFVIIVIDYIQPNQRKLAESD